MFRASFSLFCLICCLQCKKELLSVPINAIMDRELYEREWNNMREDSCQLVGMAQRGWNGEMKYGDDWKA